MISQHGVSGGTSVNLADLSEIPSDYTPNLYLDGVLGEISAGAGKIKFNYDGSGHLANNNIH
jgi:hypothetical protein